MAKKLKDLREWEIILKEENSADPSTPSRRSRRGAEQSQSIKVHREVDDTTLAKGDCLLLSGDSKQGKGGSYIGVIADISMGIQKYLDITVISFVKALEINPDILTDKVEGELLITCETTSIKLTDFVEKVTVLAYNEYQQVKDGGILSSSVFFCRKATDRMHQQLSPEFDFKEWHQFLLENMQEAISYLADRTLIIISPKKSKRVLKSIHQSRQVSPSPSKVKTYNEDDYADYVSSDESRFDLSSDENDDPEVRKPTKLVSPRKRKAQSVNSTPKKKAREAALESGALKQVLNVLSPLKKGFKVKSNAASLPSLSTSNLPTKKKKSTTSEAFRELREKLHTSIRIDLLPCREEEVEQLYMNLESAVMEGVGCCLYVSGTPGVGKTATIREAIGSLRENVTLGYVDDFDFLEINSLKLVSPITAYEKLWEHLWGIKVTPSNASLLLEEYFGRKEPDNRKPLIVVIDELDQLATKNQNVMYNFFNWPTYPNSKLIVVAIANTMDLPERLLSNKIASRLGLRRYTFRGYTEDELGTIIAHRLTLLKNENKRKVTVSEDAMTYASKKVALVSGDARRALTICRRAVEIAEQDYLQSTNTNGLREDEQTFSVRISHISKAIEETTNSPLKQFIAELPFTAKLVLTGILLRVRRSGVGVVPLGDVIDEMRISLSLLTTQKSTQILQDLPGHVTYMSLLFSDDSKGASISMVRSKHLEYTVNGLVEQGIILQQNVNSQRYRLVSLNVSEDEILSVMRKDPDFAAMI